MSNVLLEIEMLLVRIYYTDWQTGIEIKQNHLIFCFLNLNWIKNLTLVNIAQTNGWFLLTGAQQNTYRARSGNEMWWIISAKDLKSSVLHMKYRSSLTVHIDVKMSWEKTVKSIELLFSIDNREIKYDWLLVDCSAMNLVNDKHIIQFDLQLDEDQLVW